MRPLALLLTLSTLALPADSRRSGPQDSLTYIRIPAGSFQMGCTREECAPDSRPVHRVSLQAFWMGQSEVTVSAYREYARRTGKPMPEAPWFNPEWIHGDLPMVQLDWHAARSYCQWAGGSLPSEAQWEYAARAGSSADPYAPLDRVAWFANNSGLVPLDGQRAYEVFSERDYPSFVRSLRQNEARPHPVMSRQPNALGLYDMLGNVWEWVEDGYDPQAYRRKVIRPVGRLKVLRGGSWAADPSMVNQSFRGHIRDTFRTTTYGVRCVLPD